MRSYPRMLAVTVVFAAVLVAVVLVVRSKPAGTAGLASTDPPGGEPSIYRQILDQLHATPAGALDPGRIRTDDPSPDQGLRWAPGALDALLGSGRGGSEWQQVLRVIRGLNRGEAVAAIKTALSDYDPQVRSRACDAVAELDSEAVDDEIREAIRMRLNDSPAHVVDAARSAAAAHGIRE